MTHITNHDTYLISTHQTNLHSRIWSTPTNLIYESNLGGHQHLQVLRLHQHRIHTTPTLTSTSTISTCTASTRLPPPPLYVHVDVGVVVAYTNSRCRCSNWKYWCSVYYIYMCCIYALATSSRSCEKRAAYPRTIHAFRACYRAAKMRRMP